MDVEDLERRYKALQWRMHPDKAVRKTPLERQFSVQHSTLINQAYGVLRAPLSRANYLVGFRGWGAGLSTILKGQLPGRFQGLALRVQYDFNPGPLAAGHRANQVPTVART